jgi:hypothetical protein
LKPLTPQQEAFAQAIAAAADGVQASRAPATRPECRSRRCQPSAGTSQLSARSKTSSQNHVRANELAEKARNPAAAEGSRADMGISPG